jgi:hypothetical protein
VKEHSSFKFHFKFMYLVLNTLRERFRGKRTSLVKSFALLA